MLPTRPAYDRIAVFRALMLGDFLCAVPALRALRFAYPKAQITYIGLPAVQSMAKRSGYIDSFLPFPGYPGLPEIVPDTQALSAFFAAAQAHEFDLALQMHGSGAIVNEIVGAFRARETAVFYRPGDYRPMPHLSRRWPEHGHEIERLLLMIDLLGIPRRGTQLEYPIDACERAALYDRLPQLSARPYLCIHPGAQLASRRWPVERFATVARALLQRGYAVVITGVQEDAALAHAIQQYCDGQVLDLTGQTTLGELGVLIADAQLVICNDTSVSHIASAQLTPSVVISNGADVARWSPKNKALHCVLWDSRACRPCAYQTCPHGHGCALAITPDLVLHQAQLMLRRYAQAPLPFSMPSRPRPRPRFALNEHK